MLSVLTVALFSLFTFNVNCGKISLGDVKDIYDTGKDIYDTGSFAYDVYTYCEASGLSNCPTIVALCTGYQYFLSPIISKNLIASVLSELAVNKYCLGEPSLKCCKTSNGCHSAFNTDAPINCEGNAAYGPTSTAGLCLAPCLEGCNGCLCNYLAECNSNRRRSLLSDASSYDTNYWKLGRMSSIYWLLTQAMYDIPAYNDDANICSCGDNSCGFIPNHKLPPCSVTLNFGDVYWEFFESDVPEPNGFTYQRITWEASVTRSSLIIDFIEWRGCQNWLFNKEILINNVPDYDLKRYNGDIITRIDDIFDEIIPIRVALPYYALIRFAIDVPQFWIKTDWILSSTWTNQTRRELLTNYSITSPTTELLKYIDYGIYPFSIFVLILIHEN